MNNYVIVTHCFMIYYVVEILLFGNSVLRHPTVKYDVSIPKKTRIYPSEYTNHQPSTIKPLSSVYIKQYVVRFNPYKSTTSVSSFFSLSLCVHEKFRKRTQLKNLQVNRFRSVFQFGSRMLLITVSFITMSHGNCVRYLL